jgi:hypothetical protein
MLYAISDSGPKIRASPGGVAYCPSCHQELIPKCGEIKIWHWAHKRNECDTWAEGETAWHLGWKLRFPSSQVEVPIIQNSVRHVADVVTSKGKIIELQHSPLTPHELHEREAFYDDLTWIFDLREPFAQNNLFFKPLKNPGLESFRWLHRRLYVLCPFWPAYWDIGMTASDDHLFLPRKIYYDEHCAGYGSFIPVERFITLMTGLSPISPTAQMSLPSLA